MLGDIGRSPVATMGAYTALPFVLETPSLSEISLLGTIIDRLERLQDLAQRSEIELTSLRNQNSELLDTVNRGFAMRLVDSAPPAKAQPDVVEVSPVRLKLRLLGPFEAQVGDAAIASWPGRKARLLLAYLALERGRMVPKDVLIELFWPGARSDRGANNLSIAIYQIRSSLAAASADAAHAITVRQGLYGLDPSRVEVDLWQLQTGLDQARHALVEGKDRRKIQALLRTAVELCRGELLASDPYEDWVAEPRRTLNAAWHQALVWLATDSSLQGDWLGVLDFAGQILQRDSCDEAAHRMLISAHLRLGNRSQAAQQYQVCVETLRDELGVRPSPETLKLAERLRD
ncbi:MAG TPA: bacterial transcriptional activator domain-containing protein [Dehalococcoidia bacterium]|jgi:DNA-binding SARP family transcriptional activator